MDKTNKPERLPVRAEAIPEEIKSLPQWCLWLWKQHDGNWTKPPYRINGDLAKNNDSSTWDTFERVFRAYNTGKWDGIGFMLTPPFVGIDLDSCINPQTKQPQDWARATIGRFKSYSEISPSNYGYKILIKGKLDKGHHNAKIGVFQNTRYFCITGHALNGFEKIEERQQELISLIRQEWPEDLEPKEKPKTASPHTEDDKLVDKMISASNGEKVIKLLNGQWDGDYSSQSEADQALVNHIVFYTQEPDQIDRIFRTSGLYRDKWDRPDYRDRTIRKALATIKETYRQPESSPKGAPTMADLKMFLDMAITKDNSLRLRRCVGD